MDEDLRLTYLARMGIEAWVPRVPDPALDGASEEAVLAEPQATAATTPAPRQDERPAADPVPTREPPEAGRRAQQPASPAAPPALGSSARQAETTSTGPAPDWDELEAQVAGCQRCGLCQGRSRTVFGVGDRRAPLMVIGEAPGAEEDRRGEPFVGRAGQLLTNMLFAMGFAREQVYIANILKCRPPENRDPRPEEVAACEPYLRRQLELVEPRLILAVGRVAAQNLLGSELPLGKLRGEVHTYGPQATPLLVTYHPAYLLRSPREKARAWEDLKRALRLLNESVPAAG